MKTIQVISDQGNVIKETAGMQLFAELTGYLGTSGKTNDKPEALADFFSKASDKDKVWAVALFCGRRPKRIINPSLLEQWCVELAGIPEWLLQECFDAVGDHSETIALLIPEQKENRIPSTRPLHYYIESMLSLEKANKTAIKEFMIHSWKEMSSPVERYVFNKLITGAFRVSVSQKILVSALARSVKLSPSSIAHQIGGNWDPSTISFNELLSESAANTDFSKPYPFYLANVLEEPPHALGQPTGWQAEWKWDGIRGQIIFRNGELFVWTREEELVTDKFPEFALLKNMLPDGVVLDGEIVAVINNQPLPFAMLQTRIGRKTLTKKQMQQVPISFFAYDLLEYENQDCRERPLFERRNKLETLIRPELDSVLKLSPVIAFHNWDSLNTMRARSREMGAGGLMLKKKDSSYQVGRNRGDWWKWKIDPLVIDAVMIYAQNGIGVRSNLFTDYTFAVRDGDRLVSFTRASSGLTDEETAEVNDFVKKNAIEKFGPVRTVKPELVFEIAFEGIAVSNRHKSGVILRSPRINRWRKDKVATDINTLGDLKNLLEIYGK